MEPTRPAPYVPFRTFLAAIEGFERDLPGQVDRSLWPSYSGAIRGQLLAALRFLGLIDEGNCTTPALRELAKPDSRRAVLRGLLERHYQPLVSLDLARTSPRQFEEAVRSIYGLGGATHKKAISFFLNAAQYSGLALSPLLKEKTRTAAFGHRKPAPAEKLPKAVEAGAAVSRRVELKSGGTVTLTASLDLFELSAEDRAFVFEMIDRLQEYEKRS
jgi:hypothetical protein